MVMAMRVPRFPTALLALLLVVAGAATGLAQGEDAAQVARLEAVRGLARQLRKAARALRPDKPEILTLLDALDALRGHEAAQAALEGVALTDAEIRERIFALVDREHGPELVEPLSGVLSAKQHRRDADLRRRVARSLGVAGAPAAVAPLTTLIRTDEDAGVVAAAADALATYAAAPLGARKEAVRTLIDVYESTWNLSLSIHPEDKVIATVMKERWRIYGSAVRHALQALTGQTLTRPQEWRWWWNKNKKRTDW
jgi:hypothetical protein